MKVAAVSLYFGQDEINKIDTILDKSIPDDFWFYSNDKDSYINGKVIDILHLTLIYGLDYSKFSDKELQDIIKNFDINEEVDLGDLEFFNIKDNAFAAVYLKVLPAERFEGPRNELLKLPHFKEFIRQEFIPHICLGFVKIDKVGEIKKMNLNFGSSLKIDRVDVYSK